MSPNPVLLDTGRAGGTASEEAVRTRGPVAARSVVARHHSRRDWWTRRALAVGDGVGLVLAFALTQSTFSTRPGGISALAWFVLAVPFWVVLFRAYSLYDRDGKRLNHTTLDDVPMLFQAILLGSLGLWAYFRIHPGQDLIAGDVLAFAGWSFVTVLATRVLVRAVLRRSLGPARALLVGADRTTAAFVRKVRAHPEYRIEPVGLAGSENGHLPADVLQLDDVDGLDIETVLGLHKIEHVVISHAALDEDALFELIQVCKASGARISLLPQLSDALGPALEVDDVEGLTVLGLHPPVLPHSSRGLKRGMDIVVSAAMLVLLAPLLLAIALAIKLGSEGPVLFRQKRVGKAGERFDVLKFRSMIVDAEARVAELWAASQDPNWLKLEHDPRITRTGRFLRHSSLDELPQLWNVLRGQMSLVGPRPLIESEDRLVEGWVRGRLDLTPGVTGLWQVLGRTSIPFEEMVKLDYLYVTNWSLWNDVRLIIRTVPAVLQKRGVN